MHHLISSVQLSREETRTPDSGESPSSASCFDQQPEESGGARDGGRIQNACDAGEQIA
jgi:hypothetical protein